MMNRANNQQQHQMLQQQQQQQQQIRSSKTMPQLNYTKADIQEQYLSTTRVRHENRILAEQQQQQARSTQRGGGELRQSVKLKRSQQLAKFDDGLESSHQEHQQQQQQQGFETRELRGDGGQRATPTTGADSYSKKRRKRSHSASRLLSACFSIPSQLASSVGNPSATAAAAGGAGGGHSPSGAKSRASAILSHFGLGGGGQHTRHKRSTGDNDLDDELDSAAGHYQGPMRPLSNSRTLGNMQRLNQQQQQEDTSAQEAGHEEPQGGRLKHVSFGSGGAGSQGERQQQQQQQANPTPTTQINVINSKQPPLAPPPPQQVTVAPKPAGVVCRQPVSSMQAGGSGGGGLPPPRPPPATTGISGGLSRPQHAQLPQEPIYRRLPSVPMRTQATQTEITAYHLMAGGGVSGQSASSPGPASPRQPRLSQHDSPARPPSAAATGAASASQRSTPTNSSTLATTAADLASSSAAAPAATGTGPPSGRDCGPERHGLSQPPGDLAAKLAAENAREASANQELHDEEEEEEEEAEELELELERASCKLQASLLLDSTSSSNSSSTHSLVGHDSALADELQCDLKIGSPAATAQLPAAAATATSSSSSSGAQAGRHSSIPAAAVSHQAETSIMKFHEQQHEPAAAAVAPVGPSARGANMHEQAPAAAAAEIEPPNLFKDAAAAASAGAYGANENRQASATVAAVADDDEEPSLAVSEASSQTDGSLPGHILDKIGARLADDAAAAGDNAPSSSLPRSGPTAAAAGDQDEDATPRPTPTRDGARPRRSLAEPAAPDAPDSSISQRGGILGARASLGGGGGGAGAARQMHTTSRLNDSNEAKSTFDIDSSAGAQGRRASQPPTPAEQRRDDFLTLERRLPAAQHNSDNNNNGAVGGEPQAASAASTLAAAALLSATLEDVEPISTASSAGDGGGGGLGDDDEDPTSNDQPHHRARLIEEDQPLVLQRATLEEAAGSVVRYPRQSSTSTLSTRHHSYCSSSATTTPAAASGAPSSLVQFEFGLGPGPAHDDGQPPSSPPDAADEKSEPSFYDRRLEDDEDEDVQEALADEASNDRSLDGGGGARAGQEKQRQTEGVTGPSSSPQSEGGESSSRQTPGKSTRRDSAALLVLESEPAAPGLAAAAATVDRAEQMEPSGGVSPLQPAGALLAAAAATNGAARNGATAEPEATEPPAAANDSERAQVGHTSAIISPAILADDPGAGLGAQEPGPAVASDNKGAAPGVVAVAATAKVGQDAAAPEGVQAPQTHISSRVEVPAEIGASSRRRSSSNADVSDAETIKVQAPGSAQEVRGAQEEDEEPPRRASSPSPPTTVSELDADEELSAASFVDNYQLRLEAQVGELAESFARGLIGECLAAPEVAAGSRASKGELSGCSARAGYATGPSSLSPSASCSSASNNSSTTSSASSAASATTTTSVGGTSYVCLDNGTIARRGAEEQVPASSSLSTEALPQSGPPPARPQVPRKPAHLLLQAASQSSGNTTAVAAAKAEPEAPGGQFESIRPSDGRSAADADAVEGELSPSVSSEPCHASDQERAAAVAVAATSIAAALHQSSQAQQQQQLEQRLAQAQEQKEEDEEERPLAQEASDWTSENHQAEELAQEELTHRSCEETPAGRELARAEPLALASDELREQGGLECAHEDEEAQPQSVIELSTLSEVSNESTGGELSAATSQSVVVATEKQQQQQQSETAAGQVQRSEPGVEVGVRTPLAARSSARLVRHRSESFERAKQTAAGSSTGSSPGGAASSLCGAQVSQAPAKRRRSSSSSLSGERNLQQQQQQQQPPAASITSKLPPGGTPSSLARSSPGVDCPYPHDIGPLPSSSPISFSRSSSLASTTSAGGGALTMSSTTQVAAVSGGGGVAAPSRTQQPATPPLPTATPTGDASTSSTSSSGAAAAAAPAATRRLSHDDTMEAIEDDVEGEEQEMRLEEQELQRARSRSQTPEPPSIAPPAGFSSSASWSGEASAALVHSGETSRPAQVLQQQRRPSSSLGGQSIQEEDEEADSDDGEEVGAEAEPEVADDADREEENLVRQDEDEESSISVSQQHGVVVTREVTHLRLDNERQDNDHDHEQPDASQMPLGPSASGIQMKRFKQYNSHSSSASSGSSASSPTGSGSSTAAHATPISSPTSTPTSKSSSRDNSGNSTKSDRSESQREPLVESRRAETSAAQVAGGEVEQQPPPATQHLLDEVQQQNVAEIETPAHRAEPLSENTAPETTTPETTTPRSEPEPEVQGATNEASEMATHAILEHLSRRRHPSLAAVATLEEPAQSLELCRSIDPQQRRASWRRESETSRMNSSSSSTLTTTTTTLAPTASLAAEPQAQHSEALREEGGGLVSEESPPPQSCSLAPTATMKRRRQAPAATTNTDSVETEPLAVETIPMQLEGSAGVRKPLTEQTPPAAPPVEPQQQQQASSAHEQTPPPGGKRRPPLKQLKSPNQQQQQQSHSLDRTDADGSICSSCSCMETSFDQAASSTANKQQQVAPQQQPQQHQQKLPERPPVAAASVEQRTGSSGAKGRATAAWMSQEEGTVFTENYWLSHWLYISEHEEAEIWRRAIDMSGSGGGSSGAVAGNQEDEPLGCRATIAGMPANMSETASTISERSFNARYKSTTRKMIHRRASIEMYKRIMSNSLRREKRIEISRSSVGEFGFRIHGSRPVVVSAIERGTSAETCGLQVGDVIYAINDTNILDMAHSDVVRLAHQADASSALVLDLIPTNGFLLQQQQQQQQQTQSDNPQVLMGKRYEPTVTGHLMRLSASTAQPLLVQLQEALAQEGGLASAQQRAAKLNRVMRRAWRARYFVLRADNCLYWYKSARDTVEPHGGLNLQGFSATLTDEFSEPAYVVRLVKYGGQPHYLGSNNLCDVQTWVDAINRAATEANQCDPYMKRTLVLARGKPHEILGPDCSGWLYKFSHKRGGGAHWRAAYFVLKDACLYLFRSQRAELVEQASAVYYLHGYRVRSKHIEHKRHTFELVPPNRKTIKPMFLMASNEIDKKRWIAALEYSIDRWVEIN